MLVHPTDGLLNRFADRELPRPWRALVARHLQGCARCRSRVMEIRALGRDLRALEAPAPAPALRQRVLAAAAAGADPILPLASAAPLRRRWERLGWAAAAMVVFGFALRMVLAPPALESEGSALRFEPEHPAAGDTLEVEYLATPRLAGQERVRLRASFRRADDAPQAAPPRVQVAVLTRDGDRTFHGTVALPPGVVYAVFAVEDEAGDWVDGRGRLGFELLTYENGRPSYDALLQRANEAQWRDIGAALEAVKEATDRFPEGIEAQSLRLLWEQQAVGITAEDSVGAAYQPLLRAFDAELRDSIVSPKVAEAMYFFAERARADDIAARWHARLIADAPRSTYAARLRAVDILLSADSADPTPALAAFEALWGEADPEPRVAKFAFDFSRGVGRDLETVRWASRLLREDPSRRLDVARDLLDLPVARDSVLEWLEEERRALERPDDSRRPLYVTVAEQRRADERTRNEVLGLMGRVRLAAGDVHGGLALLDSATARGWSLPLIENLADARLRVGEVQGAVEMLARLAVDPAYDGEAPDPEARALALVSRDEWDAATQAAEELMLQETESEMSDPIPLPRSLRVAAPDGTARALRRLIDGRITAVAAFWPRDRRSYAEFRELQEELRRLPQPPEAILIATKPISSAQLEALRVAGVTLPVVIDAYNEFASAAGAWGFPSYFLIDANGVVRFSDTALEDLPRKVLALQRSERPMAAAGPSGR